MIVRLRTRATPTPALVGTLAEPHSPLPPTLSTYTFTNERIHTAGSHTPSRMKRIHCYRVAFGILWHFDAHVDRSRKIQRELRAQQRLSTGSERWVIY